MTNNKDNETRKGYDIDTSFLLFTAVTSQWSIYALNGHKDVTAVQVFHFMDHKNG
jgi:hypothetical protein